MSLLESARGPGLAIALAVFFLGIAWRLYRIFRLPAAVDLSEPRSRKTALGALHGIVRRMGHPATLRLISDWDDYASWAITMLPMVTGMAALSQPLDLPYACPSRTARRSTDGIAGWEACWNSSPTASKPRPRRVDRDQADAPSTAHHLKNCCKVCQ